jgi:protein-S-isoprenylcysteine O-methyltransferase Ste14
MWLCWALKVLGTLALILYAIAMAMFGRTLFPPLVPRPLAPASLLILIGAALELGHYAILKRKAGNLKKPPLLVREGGLYGRARHPMYLGDMAMILGFFLLTADWIAFLIALVALLAATRLAALEDQALALRFPEEHAEWKSRTGRLIPRIF